MRNVEKKEVKLKDVSTSSKKKALVYRVIFGCADEIKKDIDNYLIDLVFADPTKDLTTAKNRIKRFIKTKSDNEKHGIVAEMMSHIIIRDEIKMEHLGLLINLEDNSMKKGFDGVYQKDNDVWFGESKSVYDSDEKHKDNIDEALRCFKNKINGYATNNPWSNAITHFCRLNNGIKVSDSLRKRIDILSDDFENGVYQDEKDYNVIPVSTLFIDDNQSFDDILKDVEKIISRVSYKQMIVLCIDNDFYNEIIDYLGGK